MLWVQSDTSLAALIIRYDFNFQAQGSSASLMIGSYYFYINFAVYSTFNSFYLLLPYIQLRGRSGRQGDPGSSRFFLSLEDNIFRIFGGDRIQVFSSSRIMSLFIRI